MRVLAHLTVHLSDQGYEDCIFAFFNARVCLNFCNTFPSAPRKSVVVNIEHCLLHFFDFPHSTLRKLEKQQIYKGKAMRILSFFQGRHGSYGFRQLTVCCVVKLHECF